MCFIIPFFPWIIGWPNCKIFICGKEILIIYIFLHQHIHFIIITSSSLKFGCKIRWHSDLDYIKYLWVWLSWICKQMTFLKTWSHIKSFTINALFSSDTINKPHFPSRISEKSTFWKISLSAKILGNCYPLPCPCFSLSPNEESKQCFKSSMSWSSVF